MHPTAVYNHFESRDDLLYAVAVRALDTLTAVAEQAPGGSRSFQNLAATYLQPDMREHRQILAEIHVASGRHERLATLLSGWHERWADAMIEWLPPTDESPRATVQALFLLLLGLCHVDQLSAVRAPRRGRHRPGGRPGRTAHPRRPTDHPQPDLSHWCLAPM